MSILAFLNTETGEVNTLSPRRPLREHNLIKIREKLEALSSGMEITITYVPALRQRFNSSTLTDITKHTLEGVLKRHNFDIVLVGEFSETGLYHMHGIVKAETGRVVDALKRRLGRELGRVEIKQISFTESYINYVLKDINKGRIIYSDEVIGFSVK